MKKVLLVILCVVLVLVLAGGGYAWYTYQNTGEDSIPSPVVEVLGVPLTPVYAEWSQPVLGGLAYKDLAYVIDAVPTLLGETETAELTFALPDGYESMLTVSREDAVLYHGSCEGWDAALAADAGDYQVQIQCTLPAGGNTGYGIFRYIAWFTVVPPPAPPPSLAAGRTELAQGDIFSLYVGPLQGGPAPTAETDLGAVVFTPWQDGWFAAVPVGNNASPGTYQVKVAAGEYTWETEVSVVPFSFDTQNLEIDTSDPVITEANSDAAYQQYREKIPPLFNTFDEERYWEGVFIAPAQGWVSTQFGSIRYTNGDWDNPRSHNGMDIAAEEGSDVIAPNNGRVVLAEYLLNTGWTIVIEHGGGLKSYYFHMSEIYVEPDDMVTTGQLIGLVGSTGYSTGAHLHYEMRIGSAPISPSMLFYPEAGLYSALLEGEAAA
ncbi:M23 family metallopeptidase [Ruminococcaceae bacterium OttesenSCG-928-O06]|nr:M23 family metallopeptidase [Ruminococcaceae bacterium OttesenSCG-928-O06]